MEFCIHNAHIVLLLPLFAAIFIFIYANSGFFVSRRASLFITLLSTFGGFLISCGLLNYCLHNPNVFIEDNIPWISIGDVRLYIGYVVDNLSVAMMFLITSISFLVQIYSYEYMKKDESFQRFFIYLNIFNFSMLGLVMASNIFQTYIFWELVGVSSYLLIGFWYKKPAASNAAKKAFWANRIGDFGLLAGVCSFFYFSYQGWGNLDFVTLGFSNLPMLANIAYSSLSTGFYTIFCLLFLIAAIAKSAQFPLQIWLPDAMEGPTPVSALIHSATMVCAGVFLIMRLYPVFVLSPLTMNIIIFVGLASAILGAISAVSQNDIKKILAYSTISQLGFMFLALGSGAYTAGFFHLLTHAYFKAMLFLCAGIVIISTLGQHNVKYMGGLKKIMPITAICYLIGCLSASGMLLSGFYSKDAIFVSLLNSQKYSVLIAILIVTFLTAIYMFRSYFLIFEGEYKGSTTLQKPSRITVLPVAIMAFPAAFLGIIIFKSIDGFIFFQNPETFKQNGLLAFVSLLVVGGAIYLSYLIYKEKKIESLRLKYLHNLSLKGFYFDEIYGFIVKNILLTVCKFLDLFDRYVIDGFVNVLGSGSKRVSKTFSQFHNGSFQLYILYAFAFIAFFIAAGMAVYFKVLKG